MTPLFTGKDVGAGVARAGEYARHRPEQTLLYQLVEQYYPAFAEHLAARERTFSAGATQCMHSVPLFHPFNEG